MLKKDDVCIVIKEYLYNMDEGMYALVGDIVVVTEDSECPICEIGRRLRLSLLDSELEFLSKL